MLRPFFMHKEKKLNIIKNKKEASKEPESFQDWLRNTKNTRWSYYNFITAKKYLFLK